MNSLGKFIELNASLRLRIAVVGDSVIDDYFQVSANRVSPEFAIPVLLSSTSSPELRLPGGAANTCRQFMHFNVDARLHTFVDQDLRDIMARYGMSDAGCGIAPMGSIPRKMRLYQGDFPLCRWDVERPDYGLPKDRISKLRRALFSKYRQCDRPDVTVFSDYGKGVFSPSEPWTTVSEGTISIVDPKRGPLSQWIGCHVFKPNAKEAAELSCRSDWHDQAEFFRDELSCDSVVITRGGEGVCGKSNGSFFEYRPKRTRSVESVIGAGDCFVAMLAMCLGHKMPVDEAVEVAWEAGASYVSKKHNEPIRPNELFCESDPERAKFVDPVALSPANRNHKLTFTNGCFDMLHPGHMSLLRRCRSIGNKLVVAINSDDSVRRLKGDSRPVVPLEDRMRSVALLSCVDYVLSFDQDTPAELIENIRPDVLVKGGSYSEDQVVGRENSGSVVILPMHGDYSTTRLVQKCT